MSKSNVTENDLIKFIFKDTAMPAYGGTLYIHFHTADPGEGGTSSTNEAAYTGYLRIATTRGADWTVCDADGTPNANGSAAKNTNIVTGTECTGVADDETLTHGSICTSGGQILYKGALTNQIRITHLSTPIFAPGAMIFKED
jgi:hypothetical protein